MSYGANTYGVATYGGQAQATVVEPGAALTSSSTLTVAAAAAVDASVAMVSTSALSVLDDNKVNLLSASTLGVAGTTTEVGSAALAGVSTLTVNAAVQTTVTGDAALSSVSTLGVAAIKTTTGVVTLRSTSSLQVVGSTRVPFVPANVVARVILLASSTMAGAFGFVADRGADTMALSLDSSTVPAQPGQLLASIGNGVPYAVVTFAIDGGATVATVTLDGTGTILSVGVPVNGRTVATHVLTATGGGRTAQVSFQVLAVEATTIIVTPVLPPLVPVAAIQRWTFQAYNFDFSNLGPLLGYVFAINPDQVSQDFGGVAITSQPTTVVNGLVLGWEGEPVPLRWSWSGRVLTQFDHDELKFWAGRNDRVWVTDEFRRRYLMKIESLSMTRVRDVSRPWHHQYTMTASVLDGAGVLLV